MSPERLPKVSPFLLPEQEEDKHSDLFIVRAVLLILSSALFLFVFAAGGKLIYEVLLAENTVPNPHVLMRLFLISLVYVIGWILAKFNTSSLHSLIQPIIIK